MIPDMAHIVMADSLEVTDIPPKVMHIIVILIDIGVDCVGVKIDSTNLWELDYIMNGALQPPIHFNHDLSYVFAAGTSWDVFENVVNMQALRGKP